MGNCIVIHQKNHSASKLPWSPNILDSQVSLKPQSPSMAHVSTFQDLSGSKDEIYFDANANASVWMDSDCDDFFSVNGDTPCSSRGTTPVHPNGVVEPSQNGIKQLIEFFRESFSGEMVDRDQYLQGFLGTTPKQSPHKPSLESTGRKQKSPRCCLPSMSLVRSLSITDRKKRPCSADSATG